MRLADTTARTDPSFVSKCTSRPPFGPGFSAEDVEAAERVERHDTEMSDPGDDYCLFKLFAADGREIARKKIDGY